MLSTLPSTNLRHSLIPATVKKTNYPSQNQHSPSFACSSSHQSFFLKFSLLEENGLFLQLPPTPFLSHSLFSVCQDQSEPRQQESWGHLNFASEDRCVVLGGHTCGWELGVSLERQGLPLLISLLQTFQLWRTVFQISGGLVQPVKGLETPVKM